MPKAHLTFRVPRGDVSALAEAIGNEYGQISAIPDDGSDDLDTVREYLAANAGELVEVEFEDFRDNPIDAILPALHAAVTPYLGYWESYEERSRGDRYEGGYAVRVDHLADPVLKSVPWKEGEPGPLDEDMRKAGFTDEEIGDIRTAFYGEAAAPRP